MHSRRGPVFEVASPRIIRARNGSLRNFAATCPTAENGAADGIPSVGRRNRYLPLIGIATTVDVSPGTVAVLDLSAT